MGVWATLAAIAQSPEISLSAISRREMSKRSESGQEIRAALTIVHAMLVLSKGIVPLIFHLADCTMSAGDNTSAALASD